MDFETKQYELGYHLMPELEGAELLAAAKSVEQTITDNGAKIVSAREPRKQHLSYPIKLKHYGNFGIFEVEIVPESLIKLNAALKLQSDLLRFVLVHSNQNKKVLRSLTPRRGRIKTKIEDRLEQAKSAKDQLPVNEGEIEKQLEDVIEKL